jgi:hypothetical protein
MLQKIINKNMVGKKIKTSIEREKKKEKREKKRKKRNL